MNRNDKSNLDFLMNLTPESLAKWYAQASEDDITYATELLNQYEQMLDKEFFGAALIPASTTLH
jgi:hypothetical protein